MKDCPSMGLNYAICRGDRAEWILFALVGDHSAGSTTPIFSNDTIENEHWYSVLLSLNNIPDLCNSFAAGLKVGNPTRKRRTHFEMGGVPRLRSQGAQVLKIPPGGKRSHRPCPKHVDGIEHAKDQRNHCKYLNKVIDRHSSNSDRSHE